MKLLPAMIVVLLGLARSAVAAETAPAPAASTPSPSREDPLALNDPLAQLMSDAPTNLVPVVATAAPQPPAPPRKEVTRSREPVVRPRVPGPADLPALKAHLARHPDDALALRLYGSLLFQMGDLTNAAAHLAHSLQLNPGSPVAVNNYAASLIKLGQLTEARDVLEQSLDLDPENGWQLFNLACLETALGHQEEAMGLLFKVESLRWVPLAVHLADPDLDSLRERGDFRLLHKRVAGALDRKVMEKGVKK